MHVFVITLSSIAPLLLQLALGFGVVLVLAVFTIVDARDRRALRGDGGASPRVSSRGDLGSTRKLRATRRLRRNQPAHA